MSFLALSFKRQRGEREDAMELSTWYGDSGCSFKQLMSLLFTSGTDMVVTVAGGPVSQIDL